jgi:hypothetical protein
MELERSLENEEYQLVENSHHITSMNELPHIVQQDFDDKEWL